MQEPDWQKQIELLEKRREKARRLLGVRAGADDQTIRAAWRRISKQTHPDTNAGNPNANRKFMLAKAAYRLLMEGKGGHLLDELDEQTQAGQLTDGKYLMENHPGYLAWWQENFG
ncbi:MAG: J domain-containing protein [Phycisphaerae bacterium]